MITIAVRLHEAPWEPSLGACFFGIDHAFGDGMIANSAYFSQDHKEHRP